MKYIISFLIVGSVNAAPIFIYHENNSEDAKIYQTILSEDYHIPLELMTIRGIEDCQRVRPEGKLGFCLKNNGDLYMVSVDREFINESLKVFQNP